MRLTSLVLVLALAACATHRDIQPQAKLRTADSLGNLPPSFVDDAQQPVAEYWRRLGDPQLDALIAQALAESPTLRLADSRIRRAAAITDAAQSATLPQVNANFESTVQRYSEHSLVPPPTAGSTRSSNRLALDASIDLDLWGKYRDALKGAQAQRHLAEVEARAARLALASAIARNWVEYDRLHQQRDRLQQQIALRRELEKLQSIRMQAGLDAEFDRNQQQFGIASLQTDLAQLDERISLQQGVLAALAGQGQEAAAALPRPQLRSSLDARLPSALPADLLGRRPDVLASRWRVEAAARDIDVARAQFYPNVNLAAFVGFASLGLEKLLDAGSVTAGAGPAIRLPVFEAGRLRANLSGRTADYDAAVEQYNATLLDALHEVSDYARILAGSRQQDEQAELALKAAQRGVSLLETRISQRLASRVQLIGAQLQLSAQDRLMTDLRARRLDAALGLERALGAGFVPDADPFTLAAR